MFWWDTNSLLAVEMGRPVSPSIQASQVAFSRPGSKPISAVDYDFQSFEVASLKRTEVNEMQSSILDAEIRRVGVLKTSPTGVRFLLLH
jgi:hypothetical protein